MPRIPEYNAGQARNEALPSVRSSPNATAASFGGAAASQLNDVAEGFGKAGYVAGNIAIDIQDTQNKTLVRDALNKARTDIRTYLTTDIYQREGLNASNVVPEVQKKLGKVRDDLGKGFQNNVQREMFRQMFSDIESDHIGQVLEFQMRQVKAAEKATRAAENMNAIQDAVLNRLDPKAIEKAEQTIGWNTSADHKGLGTEVKKAEVSKGLSVLHSKILESIMMGSARDALDYLEANKHKFLPSDYIDHKNKLQGQVKSEISTENSIRLSLGSVEEARSWVDQNVNDPEVAEMTMAGVKTRLAEKQAALTAQQKAQVEKDWQIVIDNPKADIPKTLPPDEFIKAQDYRRKEAERATRPKDTNPQIYGMLLDKVASGQLEPKEIYQHAGDLSQTDFRFLRELVASQIKAEDNKTDAWKEGLQMAKTRIAQSSYFNVSESAGKQQEANAIRRNHFLSEFKKRLDGLSDEERNDPVIVDQKIDELMSDVITKKYGLFGWDKLARDINHGKRFEVDSGLIKPSETDGKITPGIRVKQGGKIYIIQADGSAKEVQ